MNVSYVNRTVSGRVSSVYRSLNCLVQELLSELASIRAEVGSHGTISLSTADLEDNASTIAADDSEDRYLQGMIL